jgi:hypothetical protein
MVWQTEIAKLLATPELPDLGPGPRGGVRTELELAAELTKLFKSSGLPAERQELIRALLLLWHDHLDAAHEIAQAVDNHDGAFVHGIMHRREPDYGNAAYWFRRVGEHPAFPEIARRVTTLLESEGEAALPHKLLPNGKWAPFAFIDVCQEAAEARKPARNTTLLREVQKIESEVLLDLLANGT